MSSPEEHAFFPEELPEPILELTNNYKYYLKPNSINFNSRIKALYEGIILPLICEEGDDQNYGSTATCDIHILQSLSKRVHYGKYVAEVKYQQETEKFEKAILERDSDALMQYITNQEVEDRLLERILVKASTYGQDIVGAGSRATQFKVEPQVIVDLYKNFLIPITKDIEVDYLLQRMSSSLDVAYLGPAGTFTHQAATQFFAKTKEVSFTECESIPKVVEAVLSNRAIYGVIPYSNSFAGLVPATNELMYQTSAHTCGEITIPISLCLASKGSVNLSKIKTVYSHPHALAQSKSWIRDNLGVDVVTIATSSTAEAAKIVFSSDSQDCASLSSKQAVEMYGLTTLVIHAQDTPQSFTRFLVISKQYGKSASGNDRSFIRFTLLNTAGALSSALATFGKHAINLHHIESKMITSNSLDDTSAKFLIEISGHESDQSVSNAITTLSEFSQKIHVIGSFPHQNPK